MAGAAVPVVAATVLVAPLFATSAEAARPQATTTRTVTTTVTVTAPAETVTVTQAPVTTTVTVTASSTSATTTTTPATTSSTTVSSGWPGPDNTGVPAGTSLTVVSGDYAANQPNQVVDALDIRGTLIITASGVTVTRTRTAEGIYVPDSVGSPSFTVSDSDIFATDTNFKAISAPGNFTVLRSEVNGGSSAAFCSNCTFRDSWLHNSTVLPSTSTAHMSAVRVSRFGTVVHNTIACEVKQSAADGGCSAGLTQYGDFEPVTNNLIENNLFQAMPYASYCAYGGASGGKPYSGQDHDIVFRNNVFERGSTGRCGVYAVLGDFDPNRPGNQLVGNTYTDGTPVTIADVG